MDITPVMPRGKQVITGYGSGQFKINGQVYPHPVIVFSDRVLTWNIKPNVAITLESLAPIMKAEGEVELLLIGCGKSQAILPAKIKDALKTAGIALEVMDTGAAVRTYNVTLAEGRRVAAALISV